MARSAHRSASALLPLAAVALLLAGALRAASFVGSAPHRRAPVVQRQFMGGESKPQSQQSTGSAAATDVTAADKMKEFWENPTVQGAFGFLMTASTVLDVFGLFTGEVGVGLGISEAVAGLDATAALGESQAVAEAAVNVVEAAEGGGAETAAETEKSISDLLMKR